MAEGDQLFGSILLAGRSGTLQGQLRFSSSGIVWRKSGGGRTVEIPQKDMDGWSWTKTSRGGQLAINRKQDSVIQFLGFREKDFDSLQDFAKKLGFLIKEEPPCISGRSWGTAEVENSTLTFRVDNKVAFRLPLVEVGQVQQGREEVMLELPVDDTAGRELWTVPVRLPTSGNCTKLCWALMSGGILYVGGWYADVLHKE